MDFIVRQKGFWAEDDESVLKAIHEGFIQTHYAMWKELGESLKPPIPQNKANTPLFRKMAQNSKWFAKHCWNNSKHCLHQEGQDFHRARRRLGHHPGQSGPRQSRDMESRATDKGSQARVTW